ncbi:hypothetical protein BgiMline_019990 [Biomphalaria glabrata]
MTRRAGLLLIPGSHISPYRHDRRYKCQAFEAQASCNKTRAIFRSARLTRNSSPGYSRFHLALPILLSKLVDPSAFFKGCLTIPEQFMLRQIQSTTSVKDKPSAFSKFLFYQQLITGVLYQTKTSDPRLQSGHYGKVWTSRQDTISTVPHSTWYLFFTGLEVQHRTL